MLEELTDQEKKELLYISSIILISSDKAIGECSKRSSIVPELIYVLEPDVLITLMHTFPGQWIRIPSVEDIGRATKVIYYYYYTEILKTPPDDALRVLGIKKDDHRIFSARITRLKEFFRNNLFKIPDRLCTTEFIRKINESLCREDPEN